MNNYGAPSADYNTDTAFAAIAKLISHTNNGKLLVARIPVGLRGWVPYLWEERRLNFATFMYSGDSIRVAA